MPQYEFHCAHCGPFVCWRPLAEAHMPVTCPQCQAIAKRVYTAPGLIKTPPALAHALYRAEKSAHEPDVVSRTQETPSPTIYQSHGRPWQLGH
ncbi:MAG: hypothetical protein J2P37_21485 [Ktedonobacteraceae bacterium]|nr:hypothetical protein [Ktedonobacteraceae bacterium]MBO0791082.1 hypothetical protein [Ktedonobacteraceae bacterium]